MEKLKLHSPDFTQANIAKLAELFPNCVTESRAEDGTVKRAIDFDQLRQDLATAIVEGPQERYQLNWPGKREALLTANAPIAKTLRPCREESVDFDTTQNLFIEGDNLDALKLLQETYLNKVKMIYIDPPYNTGTDFLYEDDFAEDVASYFLRTNQVNDDGLRLIQNTDANGRFHSDWLSMIYSRLKLAQRLLSDDGLIFISIGDREVANLRRVCDEIFGEGNFLAQFLWKKKSTTSNVRGAEVSSQIDYQICYKKSPVANVKQRMKAKESRSYPNADKEGSYRTTVIEKKDSGGYKRDTMKFPILGHRPRTGKRWQIGEATAKELEKKNRFVFDGEKILLKIYEPEDEDTFSAQPNFIDGFGTSDSGAKEVNEEIFGISELFDNPKPTELIKYFIDIATKPNDIILDFFAGSGTTGHAVMLKNLDDNGQRKFVIIQVAEPCDASSEAYKANYHSIAEISKERIRRAGKKIKAENALTAPDLDIGFRVLKIDNSNMKDVYYAPDAVAQGDLLAQVNNIREDRTAEDLLFQVLLDWGVDLALPITQEDIAGKKVFFVDGNALAACFETGINEEFVKALAARHPLRAVFRDSGFGSDSVKINIEQIFKLISPTTEVKSL